MAKVDDAKQSLASGLSFFHGLAHRDERIQEDLGRETFVEELEHERERCLDVFWARSNGFLFTLHFANNTPPM